MPTYVYKCHDCEEVFEVRHSMSYEEQLCIKCESSDVFKVPHIEISKKANGFSRSPRPGKIVDEHIREAKREVELEKQKLRKEQI